MRGKYILLAGDSIVGQTFTSLALLLANSSKPKIQVTWKGRPRGGGVRVSVCDKSVVLHFMRSDMLMWEPTQRDAKFLELWRPRPQMNDFSTFVDKADFVVLGAGSHFSNHRGPPWSSPMHTIMKKVSTPPRSWAEFFARSINRTIANVQAVRRLAGHAPTSLVLMSPTKPVDRCDLYDSPLDDTLLPARHRHALARGPPSQAHRAQLRSRIPRALIEMIVEEQTALHAISSDNLVTRFGIARLEAAAGDARALRRRRSRQHDKLRASLDLLLFLPITASRLQLEVHKAFAGGTRHN